MKTLSEALNYTRTVQAQTPIDVQPGVSIRRTNGGIPVLRLHYTAIPERATEEWRAQARKEYTSQAAWDREMDIRDDAGGGELVFADTLISYWDKIIIRDPAWRPRPEWRCEAAFDHGRTNPTALLRYYIDHEGIIYLCGEYYQPGKEVWEHAPELKKMDDIRRVAACYADPTIFDFNVQQSQQQGKPAERAKSINQLYVEQGIALFSPFAGDRVDVSFAARLMMHWSNLDRREPSVKIVCPQYSERPLYGLHNWSCPNLVWELMRRRRVKLTAQQLLTRNVAEALVDKENHLSDCLKYGLMSHPEPTVKTMQEIAREALKPMVEDHDLTSAMIRYKQLEEQQEEQAQPAVMGRYRARRCCQDWGHGFSVSNLLHRSW